MLRGVDPILSPNLVAAMGHGDDIVIADASFPAKDTAAVPSVVKAL